MARNIVIVLRNATKNSYAGHDASTTKRYHPIDNILLGLQNLVVMPTYNLSVDYPR